MSIRPSVPVTVQEDVEAMLTPELRVMLDKLTAIVLEVGDREGVPVLRMDYFPFHDPYDHCVEIVNGVAVDAPAGRAIDFMHHISDAVGAWLATLPPERQQLYNDVFGVHVNWLPDDAVV